MKFCEKCGVELVEGAVVCTNCGCAVACAGKESGMVTAAKILMILGTIFQGIYIIPLAWCIPMTVSYFKKVKNGIPVSTGFKVCSLLFVSLVGGILMLCDKEN